MTLAAKGLWDIDFCKRLHPCFNSSLILFASLDSQLGSRTERKVTKNKTWGWRVCETTDCRACRKSWNGYKTNSSRCRKGNCKVLINCTAQPWHHVICICLIKHWFYHDSGGCNHPDRFTSNSTVTVNCWRTTMMLVCLLYRHRLTGRLVLYRGPFCHPGEEWKICLQKDLCLKSQEIEFVKSNG